VTGISDEQEFIGMCRKRSVFSDDELKKYWNYNKWNRPFVVKFLSAYSLPKRPNLASLKDANIITEAPRGFEPIGDEAFSKLIELAHANNGLIVD